MKIGIIGAMDEEVSIIKEKLDQEEEIKIGNCEFYIGKLYGKDIVLLKSGIGKVNAAIATTILIERFSPNYVINTGSAGGFHHNLNVGDIVISSSVCHHDVDVTAFGYDYGQVPGLPTYFIPDEKLVQIADECAHEISHVQVAKGCIATGDSFMSDPTRVEFVREKLNDLYAVEMEGAAIAQVCKQFDVPFVVIRALSDIAGKESNVSFDQFIHQAALHSASLVEKIVEKIS